MLQGPSIQDIYPLTPLQQGILFHNLTEPEEGYYVEQLAVELDFAVELKVNILTQA
jgi:hypothetical protein